MKGPRNAGPFLLSTDVINYTRGLLLYSFYSADIVAISRAMKKIFFLILAVAATSVTFAQVTFKCGWNTYKARLIVHEYTYSYVYKDSIHLYLADSTKTFVASDSSVAMTIDYPFHDNVQYRTACYFNDKKKLARQEEYTGENLQNVKEYKYDDKGRKVLQTEDNKQTGNVYKKTYDFGNDKKTGDFIITECSAVNGRTEFYTRSYYDKNSVLYKEVRLNDNNKDVIHEEKFTYGENGKVKLRSVYFNEFKVTKTFPETAGEQPAKCYRTQPVNIPDKAAIASKVAFLKKLMAKNQSLLLDPDCHEFEYRFSNVDCEVIISTTKTNNVKQVVFRFKQRLAY